MMIHDARCAKPEVVKLLHRAMNPGEAPPKSSSKSAVLIEQAMMLMLAQPMANKPRVDMVD